MKQCAISFLLLLGNGKFVYGTELVEWGNSAKSDEREGSAVGSGLRRKKRKYCPKLLTF